MAIINLTDTDARSFEVENFIQNDAKVIFEHKVAEYLLQNEPDKNRIACKTEFKRSHNTILVNGKRGMGKTSFILSVIKQSSTWHEDVCVLDIIDPTMIEMKEHIFLNIVSSIQEQVDNKYRNCDGLNESIYQSWKQSLIKLSGGLSVLDGVGSDHLKEVLWDSPELILEKGLANAKQGSKLEKNLHAFIGESLRVLEKKAFLLVFDDIDTSLTEGKTVLETLRKYLTSPSLIVTMLGDIDLYSTIVRQLQWEKMDSNGTLKKYEDLEPFRNQIDHLEEQYLTKLLKPENRITLKSLYDLRNQITVHNSIEGNVEDLDNYVGDIVNQLFFTSGQTQYAKLYKNVLLSQSTRSVIQILKGWQLSLSKQDGMLFVVTLYQVFFTTLKKQLEPFGLLEPSSELTLSTLVKYMMHEGLSKDSGMKLLPDFDKDEKNVAIIYLNALVNTRFKPQQYLSYFVKVGYALERFNATSDAKPERFINHVGLNGSISNTKLAKRLLTTFKIGSNTHTINPVFFGNFSVKNDDLEKLESTENFALLMSRVYNPKTGRYSFLSLFNLLGVLADLSYEKTPENVLSKINLIRDFYVFDDTATVATSNEDVIEAKYAIPQFDVTLELKDQLIEWSKKAGQINQQLSLADLAKMWTRVAYSFNEIDSRSENKGKAYSALLKLYVAALLNSVYIHCEQKKGEHVDIKNPSTDPQFFYDKLKGYERGDSYSLFDYLYECPALKQDVISLPENLKSSHGSPKPVRNKKDFKKLSETEQKKAIASIDGWENYKSITVQNKLRELGYKNVPSNLEPLFIAMKSNP
ncbi:MAG: hypothetical protein IBX55_20870 [Methyloprofundus sp.]|nr:hypothetical protein [Methyloprofundus sp.]